MASLRFWYFNESIQKVDPQQRRVRFQAKKISTGERI